MSLFAPPLPVAPTNHPYMLNYPVFPYVGPKLCMSLLSILVIEFLYGLGD